MNPVNRTSPLGAVVGRELVVIKGMDLPSVDAFKEAICHGGARARPERML